MGSICVTQKSMFIIGQTNVIFAIIMLNMTCNCNKLQCIKLGIEYFAIYYNSNNNLNYN